MSSPGYEPSWRVGGGAKTWRTEKKPTAKKPAIYMKVDLLIQTKTTEIVETGVANRV